jgi:hypothetical protein
MRLISNALAVRTFWHQQKPDRRTARRDENTGLSVSVEIIFHSTIYGESPDNWDCELTVGLPTSFR